MHEFEDGDRVRYVGDPMPGSGEPELHIPDLMPGEVGWIIEMNDSGDLCVVAWDRHGTLEMGGTSDLEWLGVNESDPIKRVAAP